MNFKLIDTIAHLLLLLAFLIGIFAVYNLRFQPIYQFVVILGFATFYVCWGLVFHTLKKDLETKLFLEYLVLGLISTVVGFLIFAS
ncbi:hypothetical protein HYU92_06320 [Candidatus Curtissbacteria bacterium]|nr:hypothetical protein [Candidatus Curtissbacteria bacterium]